jgi:pantothenate kinase-related protein Tda10
MNYNRRLNFVFEVNFRNQTACFEWINVPWKLNHFRNLWLKIKQLIFEIFYFGIKLLFSWFMMVEKIRKIPGI